jgi:hypothetical protein
MFIEYVGMDKTQKVAVLITDIIITINSILNELQKFKSNF